MHENTLGHSQYLSIEAGPFELEFAGVYFEVFYTSDSSDCACHVGLGLAGFCAGI